MLDLLDKESIKNALYNYMGKTFFLKYNLGRNKYETYKVKLINLYDYIFLVETIDDNHTIKSFSYSDIITKTIKIYE